MWYECRKIADILNGWAYFEVREISQRWKKNFSISFLFQTIYYKTVGKSLLVDFKTKAVLIGILLPLLSAGSVVLTHYVINIKDTKIERSFVFQVAPYCYLDTLTYMMGAYWYLACQVLSSTAKVLAEDFQKVVNCVFDILIQVYFYFTDSQTHRPRCDGR